MIFSYNTFLRPITQSDTNIQVFDNKGVVVYTITAFSIGTTRVSNNILEIAFKSGKTISIPFSSQNEAKVALTLLQSHIDTLLTKTPSLIDIQIKNYIDHLISLNSSSGTSGSAGTSGVDGNFYGSSGSSGTSGAQGSSGLSGSSGTSGSAGTSGSSGTSGAQGSSGSSGTSGVSNRYSATSSTTIVVPDAGYLVNLNTQNSLAYTPGQSVIMFTEDPNYYVVDDYSEDYGHIIGKINYYNNLTGSMSIVTDYTQSIGNTYSYWNINLTGDYLNIIAGATGQGVPTGGSTGQVLAKIDGSDYNTHWVNQTGGGGGSAGSSGTSGSSGINGVIGSSGSSGLSGSSGTSGSSGSSGFMGATGPAGATLTVLGVYPSIYGLTTSIGGSYSVPEPTNLSTYLVQDTGRLWVYNPTSPASNGNGWVDMGQIQGPQGFSGSSGSSGISGLSGSSGTSGSHGSSGSSGVNGLTGSNGSSGSSGTSGTTPIGSVITTGSAYQSSTSILVPNATPVDIVSFTIPVAGTFEITYFLRGQSSSALFAAECALTDNSNNILANSEILSFYVNSNFSQAGTGTGKYIVTTTGATTYKLRAWASSGSYNSFSDSNGRTGVVWNSLSGHGTSGSSGQNGTSGTTPIGPQNYVQVLGPIVSVATLGTTIISGTISTTGGPVKIEVTGDANPSGGTSFVRLQLYRNNTPIGQILQAENGSNLNVPYCLSYIDNPSAGTYVYSMRTVSSIGGVMNFGEASGPTLTMIELTGSGSSGTSGISGTSGTSIAASYMRGSRSTAQTTGLSTNGLVVFTQADNSTGSDISLNTSTGQITLVAGKTYRIKGQVPTFTTNAGDVRPAFCWYNETSSSWIGNESAAYSPNSSAGYGSFAGSSEAVITVSSTTVVSFRIISTTTGLASLGGNTDFNVTGSYPWFDVQVISGNSPLVNGTSGSSGSSGTSGIGVVGFTSLFVNAGTFVTLDNLKVSVTTGGNRGLSVGAVSTTFVANVSGTYGFTGGGGGASAYNVTYTTTASSSAFSWSFGTEGDGSTYIITDKTNLRVYRVILMIGLSYLNNFISIERLK